MGKTYTDGLFGEYSAQLLPFAFFTVTPSSQQPYWLLVQLALAGTGQLVPSAFFAVTPSSQQPYWLRVQLDPATFKARVPG